ncbi:hypothetical protein [Candidatus Nitrosacidococcus tergens]|uniref:Uncharacterized protein n=1 Tax=Candidatus Nitrosacidococcus tergens TaxID=553981 RepID=A0A7G1QA18_9GAMM|nr:hypothetical protein [Candidatus Nitrosacidococcus tergens]CAB1276054.1 conserved protein of unknown function [Candidatus Nitrosacidococcus tergens]
MKKYGIYITLPSNSTMRAAHLLGENWDSYHWYYTIEDRDKAFEEMRFHLPYYQNRDNPNLIIKKVEQ